MMTDTATPTRYDKEEVRARFTLDSLAEYAAQQTGTTVEGSGTTRRLVGGNLGGLEITSKDGALLWYLHAEQLGGDLFALFGYLQLGDAEPKGELFTKALELAGEYIGAMPGDRTNGKSNGYPQPKSAPTMRPAERSSWKRDVETTYDYRDWRKDRMKKGHTGAPFYAWHTAADGREIAGRGDIPPTLYRLPELQQARSFMVAGDAPLTVFVTAGEKDCDNVRALGFVAVCNPDGEIGEDKRGTKWPDSFSQELAGCSVVIPVDNDDTGRTSAKTLTRRLYGIAASVKLLPFDGYDYIGVGGDISDWLEHGNTAEDLENLVDAATVWTPAEFNTAAPILESSDASPNGSAAATAPEGPGYEIFSPSWDNEPVATKPTISLNGIRTGSIGNIMAIVAPAGGGKSATVEMIMARAVNPEAETCGFDVHFSLSGVALYVDGERTREDHHASWRRCIKRAKLTRNDPRAERMRWRNFKSVPKTDLMKTELERELDEAEPELVILDGIGDFISDVNDAAEVDAFVKWLLAIAEARRFAVIVTIHPNPKSDKARGHLGTDTWRRCESYLNILVDKKTDIRTITSKGELGKIRSGSPVEASFCWDDSAGMHVECDPPATGNGKPAARENAVELVSKVFADRISYPYSDLLEAIIRVTGRSKETAIYHYRQMKKCDLIIQSEADKTWMRNGNAGASDDPF